MDRDSKSTNPNFGEDLGQIVWFVVLFGSLFLGIRNVRMRRSDNKGAIRIATYVLTMSLLSWIFFASHRPSLKDEAVLATFAIALAIQSGVRYWLYYVALEPYVRRLWPEALISWSRVLAGRLRDPLVGRHLLIGAAASAGFPIVHAGCHLVLGWLGLPPSSMPQLVDFDVFTSVRGMLGFIAHSQQFAIFYGLLFTSFLFILRLLLRSTWLASAVIVLVYLPVLANQSEMVTDWIQAALFLVAAVTLLIRFGLLAYIVFNFCNILLGLAALTTDHSAWYFSSGWLMAMVVLGLAVYGFCFSVGSSLWRDPLEASPLPKLSS